MHVSQQQQQPSPQTTDTFSPSPSKCLPEDVLNVYFSQIYLKNQELELQRNPQNDHTSRK